MLKMCMPRGDGSNQPFDCVVDAECVVAIVLLYTAPIESAVL